MVIDMEFSDSELVSHVKNILKSSIECHNENYNELVAIMNDDQTHCPDKIALLVTCLKSLRGVVSCMHNVHHKSLLDAIFGMRFWSYGVDVMDALGGLILSLAASSGGFVDLCLDMLVENFFGPKKGSVGLRRKNEVMERVHATLKDIPDLVPLAPMKLEKIVIERMQQSIYRPEIMFLMYVENMLMLEKGALGELVGRTMILGVVDSLIKLDVAIVLDENILRDDFINCVSDMEVGEFEGIGLIGDDGNEMRESLIRKMFGVDNFVVAMKLDKLLVLIFEHLRMCYVSGRLSKVFEILCHSFKATVLTAHQSRFAQFVMFYACSLDPEDCGKKFAMLLLDIFIDSAMYAPLWRMSAVAYLASYLSRAKFMSASFVATVLGDLAKFCSDYCKNQDGEIIDPRVHKLFYAGCQAIMYVLCFRMRSMVLIPRLKLQLRLLNVEGILRHPLSPLKVCLPSIVEEFLYVAREAQLFTVDEMHEFDDPFESELSRAFGGVERLDMFFPFDPCPLRKSDSFIRPNFVYWWMTKSMEDDAEEELGSSDDDNVAEAYGDGMVDGGGSFEVRRFGLSFDRMSIAPYESRNSLMQMPPKLRPSTSPEWF